MKIVTLLAITSAIALSPLSYPVARASGDHDHHGNAPAVVKGAGDAAELSEGEVRKVDKDAKKITLKHGELKNLEMPAMTMVFQVKDSALLDKVKTGDKVRFKAEKIGGGFAVSEIELAK